MLRRRPTLATGLAILLCSALASTAPIDSGAAIRTEAFALAYNLDRAEAMRLLERGAAEYPDDAAMHRALASLLWLQILFERGAVTADHYLGSFSRTQVDLKAPPPALDARFRQHVSRAIELADARVRRAPRDARARYDLGAAVGLQASYTAAVEGRLLAGFRSARRAYDQHERALRLDPSLKDAGLVVGLYRYVVSTLSPPMRAMAYVAGFGGGRERGIQMLEDTAAHGVDSRVDAMFALVLVYNRERRYDDALRVLGELRRMYPRNRLVVLETGSTLARAGRASEADALFTEGLAMLRAETRPLFPGEEPFWRYKRGAARAALRRVEDARADLNAALGADAQDWVSGRAHAELARLALGAGDADAALALAARAESLCVQGSDRACSEDARQLARSARGR
jgi:tetratricopeptide (TPR) repeat protein